MRIQFLLCSILALSSADLYASGNDCWRLEELMLKSLTVENRQDFLKKLEAIEAFEQERLAAVVRELEADRKLFESWMRENTGKIEEQNSGEQKEAVAAITRGLQRREKSLAEREAARKVILDMQGRLHEIDMRMGVFGWLSKAVGWNEDALRHNNYSAWKLQAEAKWIEADKELSRAQRELDRLGQNKTQSPVDSGERLRQEKERELAAKELVKRAEVSKEVQDRRADLEREIVRFMSDNDKLGTQLNAAYDRIYEAMCKAGSCLTKISQA